MKNISCWHCQLKYIITMSQMVLYCQSVVLRFGTLVIQFMFTRPLSCNIVVVALLFSYLLLFNGVLAGRGGAVMFLQTQTAVCQLLFTT